MRKVVSDKQLQANRRNARKSTGPKTPRGKARSALNAVKHGLLARSIVIDTGDGSECQADFDALLARLLEGVRPHDLGEKLHVERIAICYWWLRRAHRFEAGSILRALDDGALAFPAENDLDKLVRYESRLDRRLHAALTALRVRRNLVPVSDIMKKRNDPVETDKFRGKNQK